MVAVAGARIGHAGKDVVEGLGLRELVRNTPIATTGSAPAHSRGTDAAGPRTRTAASGRSALSHRFFSPAPA